MHLKSDEDWHHPPARVCVRALQSGRWYHKDWRGCTAIESHVLAFLVLRSEANDVALRWANDVLADVAAADYVDGQPWKPPKRCPAPAALTAWQQ